MTPSFDQSGIEIPAGRWAVLASSEMITGRKRSHFLDECKRLKVSDVIITALPDAGFLKSLKNLPGLVGVHFISVPIKNADLDYLKSDLRYLTLRNTLVNGRGIGTYARRGMLKELVFASERLTDKDLDFLVALPQLKALDLTNDHVTDASIPKLLSLKNLQSLQVCMDSFSDEGKTKLHAQNPQLELTGPACCYVDAC